MDLPPRARWAASTPSNPCGFGGNPLWAMRRLATSCVASGRHSEQVPALQVGTDVRFRPSTDEASSFGLEEGASGGFEEIPQPWIGGEHRFALVSDNQTSWSAGQSDSVSSTLTERPVTIDETPATAMDRLAKAQVAQTKRLALSPMRPPGYVSRARRVRQPC